MASTLLPLARGVMPTVAATAYTVPAGYQAIIKSIVVSNQSGTPTVTINVVPSGGSASASNAILDAVATTANSITSYTNLDIVLNSGDFISWVASAATVNAYISGIQIDPESAVQTSVAF